MRDEVIRRSIEDWRDRERLQERESVSAAIRGHMSGEAPMSAEQLLALDARITALTCLDG